MSINQKKYGLIFGLILFSIQSFSNSIGPWNIDSLFTVPQWETSNVAPEDGLTGILYHSILYKGNPVQAFAYYSLPEGEMPEGGWPAMIYAHGGGGTASDDWVRDWNNNGYAAISMDLEGHYPTEDDSGSRISTPNPGPKRVGVWDDYKLPIEEQWYYHAVAQIIRAHSLIASFSEVNADKIGLMGISWGGTLTSTVMGLDSRLKLAIPIYGTGYLSEGDGHQGEALADGAETDFVNANYDGRCYFQNVTYPTLWINGTNDFHFALPSTQLSSRAVHGSTTLRYSLRLGHSGNAPRALSEIFAFANQVFKGITPLIQLDRPKQYRDKVAVNFSPVVKAKSAQLLYTTDSGQWRERYWHDQSASIVGDSLVATIPEGTTTIIFTATDSRGLLVSSEYLEIDQKMEQDFENTDTLSINSLPMEAIDSAFFEFVPEADYGNLLTQGGTTSFSTEYQPSGSTWGSHLDEKDVYLARLKHTSGETDSWDLRIGKGGQIYSFIGPYGEGVPPSVKEQSRWNDEVWQPVSVCSELNNSDSFEGVRSMKYFIHGAGIYLNEESQTKAFYSPLMASYYNETEKAYSVTNWGQQAHVPSLHKSGLLYTTKYRDLGEGIMEATYIIQNFGTDVQDHLNMPWGGVRASSLRQKFIGLPDNSLEVGHGISIDGAFDVRDIDDTGGYIIFTQDTIAEESPSMGMVFGNKVLKNQFGDHNLSNIIFRNAQIGGDANTRDYHMFVLIPKIEIKPGETFYYRVFYINGTRASVHEKSKELVDFSEYGFIDAPIDNTPFVTIKASEMDAAFKQDINLFASPVNDMVPLFLMENAETGEQYISPDLYYNVTTEPFTNPYSPGDDKYEIYQDREVNRPYDGKVKYIKMLGYGIKKESAISNEIQFGLIDTMILNDTKVVLTDEYLNTICVPINYCKNCNENPVEEEDGFTLYHDFNDQGIAEYQSAGAVTYSDRVTNPDITAGHTDPFVGKVERGEAVHANIRFDLPKEFDFSKNPIIKLKAYFESEDGTVPDNCKITLMLRHSTNGSRQFRSDFDFTSANKWFEVEYDCTSSMALGTYDQLWLFFSMADNNLETTGQVFYFDDIRGPAFEISDFNIYTSTEGHQVTVDLWENDSDILVVEEPVFSLVRNANENIPIEATTYDDKHFYLDLDTTITLKHKDDLELTYDQGVVKDVKGKVLPFFKRKVTNNIEEEIFTLTVEVKDSVANVSLPNASVLVQDVNYETNEQGRFSIELAEGFYRLTTIANHFKTNQRSVNLTQDTSITILLQYPTQVNAFRRDEIKVFPNPASDCVEIQSSEMIKSVAIYDMSGQHKGEYYSQSNKLQIATQNLIKGIYFLKVKSENQAVFTYKLVII